jgi:hypothetical protein
MALGEKRSTFRRARQRPKIATCSRRAAAAAAAAAVAHSEIVWTAE